MALQRSGVRSPSAPPTPQIPMYFSVPMPSEASASARHFVPVYWRDAWARPPSAAAACRGQCGSFRIPRASATRSASPALTMASAWSKLVISPTATTSKPATLCRITASRRASDGKLCAAISQASTQRRIARRTDRLYHRTTWNCTSVLRRTDRLSGDRRPVRPCDRSLSLVAKKLQVSI